MWDRNQRLWSSWVIRAGDLKFYFGGDTAYPDSFPLFRQIGDRLGPFHLAALPIGAYAPSYFMKASHVSPQEAVQIHQDLRVQKSVAIHHGTFPLSEEAHCEPPRLLEEAARKAGVDFCVVPPGYCVVVGLDDEVVLPSIRAEAA
jgi:L-ascorbate metabolism protein UlaG (beta-lactamase superfamily)